MSSGSKSVVVVAGSSQHLGGIAVASFRCATLTSTTVRHIQMPQELLDTHQHVLACFDLICSAPPAEWQDMQSKQ